MAVLRLFAGIQRCFLQDVTIHCRIKVSAIDAAALGPFVKLGHGVGEAFFPVFFGCAQLAPVTAASQWRITASCSLWPPRYFCNQTHQLYLLVFSKGWCVANKGCWTSRSVLNALYGLQLQHPAQFGLNAALRTLLSPVCPYNAFFRLFVDFWRLFDFDNANIVLEWYCWKILQINYLQISIT